MIRRPPRSTPLYSSAASDVYKRQVYPQARAGRPRTPAQPPSGLGDLLTLLRVGFTEPPQSPGALVRSYRTVSPLPVPTRVGAGGLFSVALSRGSPRVGVTHHPAL